MINYVISHKLGQITHIGSSYYETFPQFNNKLCVN